MCSKIFFFFFFAFCFLEGGIGMTMYVIKMWVADSGMIAACFAEIALHFLVFSFRQGG